MIDVSKVKFTIRQVNGFFTILVRYENHSFYIFKEANLNAIKVKFLNIVKNRELLKPIVLNYLEKEAS